MNVKNEGFIHEDPAIKAKQIKNEYLSGLPNELKSKFSSLNLAIIDEAVEQIISGEATANSEIPQTKEEYFTYISYHQIKALAALSGLHTAALKSFPNHLIHVNLNYRDQKWSFDLKQKKK